jgi:transcription elongation factor SPT6
MTSTRWNPERIEDRYLYEDPNDTLYNPELEEEKGEGEEKEKRKIFNRAIVHPRFKNIDRDSVEELLRPDTVPVGQFFFRPSSMSYNQLKISWKFWNDLFVHIDITELEKPNNNNWSLGKKLKIEEDIYEDLDDIIANFVDNLNLYLNSVRDHRRFKVFQFSPLLQLISLFLSFFISLLFISSLVFLHHHHHHHHHDFIVLIMVLILY